LNLAVVTCSGTRANYTRGLGFRSIMPPSSSASAQATQSYSTPGRTNANASSCRVPCLKNNEGRGLLGRGRHGGGPCWCFDEHGAGGGGSTPRHGFWRVGGCAAAWLSGGRGLVAPLPPAVLAIELAAREARGGRASGGSCGRRGRSRFLSRARGRGRCRASWV